MSRFLLNQFTFSCLILYFSAVMVSAQTATATLTGTVADQNGAVIPSVEVTVENTGTRIKREVTTNENGSFTVPLLPPGEYTIMFRRDGFASVQVPKVVLNVGDQRSLQIGLKVGDVNTEVEVRQDESLINTSPAVTTTIDRAFAQNLPLNGRSFQSLILLTPGVTIVTQPSEGGQFSVNGQRPNTNYFTVDGVAANLGSGGGFSQNGSTPALSAFGGTNNLLSVDALEEFKIQTSSYSAELGRQPGGQVQLVSKSGKNQFSGSLFEYFRNEALDAREYFNKKPAIKPPLRQNIFGGTFGGPVYFPRLGEGEPFLYSGKDRTFFFFSYEGQRLQLPISGVANVTSLRLRELTIPALRPILNAIPIPTGPENTVACAIGTAGCLPNGTRPTGTAPYNYSLSDPSRLDSTSIRIDHTVNKNNQLFARFNESSSFIRSRFSSSLTTPSESFAATRTFTVGLSTIFSSSIANDFRFNLSRQRNDFERIFDPVGGAVPIELSSLVLGYTGTGSTVQGNISFLGGSVGLGKTATTSQHQLNFTNTLSYVNGSHSFRFGVDYRRLYNVYGPSEYMQNGIISGEANTITGQLLVFSVNTAKGSKPIYTEFSTFAQDTWKVSRRLNLDLGVRWELNPPPSEASGLKPVTAIGLDNLPTATLAGSDTPVYKTFYTAFAPRFGVSYLFREHESRETVLRGGVGVYYDLGSGSVTNGFFGTYPFVSSIQFVNTVFFPPNSTQAAPPNLPTAALPITSSITSVDPNLKLPYTLSWNVAVQQSLGKEQTLSVSYVASIARRLLVAQVLNQPQYQLFGPRPNPNFSQITYFTNGPSADYHSMQIQFQRRLSRGLQILSNYTWSHSIDDVSSEFDRSSYERGSSGFDVRHNFNSAIHYEIPGVGKSWFIKRLTNGWTIDGIVHAQSGQPINVFTFDQQVLDGKLLSVRPDLVLGQPLYVKDPGVPGGRRFNLAALAPVPTTCAPNPPGPCQNIPARQGTLGRSVFRALSLYQFDLAFGRIFRFKEKYSFHLKAEAFNVFNHPMFGGFDSFYFAGTTTFGVPTQSLNRSLGGLSSLYQIGGPRSIQLSARVSF